MKPSDVSVFLAACALCLVLAIMLTVAIVYGLACRLHVKPFFKYVIFIIQVHFYSLRLQNFNKKWSNVLIEKIANLAMCILVFNFDEMLLQRATIFGKWKNMATDDVINPHIRIKCET